MNCPAWEEMQMSLRFSPQSNYNQRERFQKVRNWENMKGKDRNHQRLQEKEILIKDLEHKQINQQRKYL